MTRAFDLRRTDVGDVYRQGVFVGNLLRTDEGTEFVYSREFLEKLPFGQEGVSWTLPPDSTPYVGTAESLPPFFANLTPEGARLAATIGRLHTSPDDLMTVLLAVGLDCAGDVQVVPEGGSLEAEGHRSAPPSIEDSDLEDLFWEAVGGERLERVSIAGVQEKASGSLVSFPSKQGFGTHPTIIKISPRAFPRLVENEAFVLGIARQARIEVNDWKLVRDRTGRSGLIVMRFDRARQGRKTVLLHQEDMCQLLGRYPWQKYRVAMRDVAAVVARRSSSPPREVLRLIELYAFSYAVGNADMHAKNLGLLHSDGVTRLCPGYDLVCTLPYGQLDARMALSLDGKDDGFSMDDLTSLGDRFDVPVALVRSRVEAICECVGAGMKEFSMIGFEEETNLRVVRTLERRLSDLSRR